MMGKQVEMSEYELEIGDVGLCGDDLREVPLIQCFVLRIDLDIRSATIDFPERLSDVGEILVKRSAYWEVRKALGLLLKVLEPLF